MRVRKAFKERMAMLEWLCRDICFLLATKVCDGAQVAATM
jgi:hypothetical protein